MRYRPPAPGETCAAPGCHRSAVQGSLLCEECEIKLAPAAPLPRRHRPLAQVLWLALLVLGVAALGLLVALAVSLNRGGG